MNHHNHPESSIENQFIYVLIRHLYICRGPSTNRLLFMQNKPNFRKSQMNVKSYNTKDYENKRDWTLGQNKPNSNPIKPNLKKAKMNVNSLITKDYRKNDALASKKTNPISETPKMNANSLITKDYRKNDALASKKTNPIQTQSHLPPKG